MNQYEAIIANLILAELNKYIENIPDGETKDICKAYSEQVVPELVEALVSGDPDFTFLAGAARQEVLNKLNSLKPKINDYVAQTLFTVLHKAAEKIPNENAKLLIENGAVDTSTDTTNYKYVPKTLKSAQENFDFAQELQMHNLYTEAIIYFDKAIEMDKKFARAYTGKGLSLLMTGKYYEAIAYCARAAYMNPYDSEAFLYKGDALTKIDKNLEALNSYDKALKINPSSAVCYMHKADCLAAMNKIDEALKVYESAAILKPDLREVYTKKAALLNKMQRYEDAVVNYDKAIELNPYIAVTYNNKGVAMHKWGKLAEAIKCFEQAIEINPEYEKAIANKEVSLKEMAG